MATVIRKPATDVQLTSSVSAVDNTPQKILVIGQKDPEDGTATAGTLVSDIQNDNSWNTLFGESSMLAGMIRNIRRYNKVNRIDAIVLDDADESTAAAGVIAFSGPATSSGVLTITVGSTIDNTVSVTVPDSSSASAIAALVVAAINDNLSIPAVADVGVDTSQVILTAINAGSVGNSIPIAVSSTVNGVEYVIDVMAGGSGDPTFTGIFDLIEGQRYQTIVWPYFSDPDTIISELDTRWSLPFEVMDGVALIGMADTYSTVNTTVSALNSQSCVFIAQSVVADTARLEGSAIVEIPYNWAATIAGIRALRLTDGASISRFIIARDGSLDRFGGMALASLPYFNTPLPNLTPMNIADGFSGEEAGNLNEAGASVIGNNPANTGVILGSMVTTYKTDSASNPDATFKYLNYVDTSSAIREYYWNNLRARFAQCRLTEGALIAGRAMANGALIESYCMGLYQDLADQALVQDGEAALQYVKDNMTVTLDLEEGSASIFMIVPIVTQLRTIYMVIQVGFTTEG